MRGCGDVAATTRGTGPGGPLAGILFAVSQTPILDEIETQLRDMGALLCLPPPGTAVLSRPGETEAHLYPSDSTLADDVVLLTVLPQEAAPEAVIGFLRQVVDTADTAFRRRGYILNYGDGKSGLMVTPSGKYARRIKQLLYLQHGGRLRVSAAVGSIKIDSAYKHLGTVATRRLSMDAEIAARTSCARSALAPLRRAVFRLKELTTRHTLSITDACVSSILFFQCGAWPPLTTAQGSRMDGMYAQIVGEATGLGRRGAQDHCTHAEIWARARRVDATTFIRLARLRMLHRITTSGPAIIRRMVDCMLHMEGTWGAALVGDINWAIGLLDRDAAITGLPGAVRLAVHGPAWASFCRKVRIAATGHHVEQCNLAVLRKELERRAPHGAPAPAPLGPAEPPDLVDGQVYLFCCHDCGATFSTAKGCNVHRLRAHGFRRPARRFAEGGTCLACGVLVHTRPRLIHHLNHGLRDCLAKYITFARPLDEDRIAELDEHDRAHRKALTSAGLRETHAEAPAVAGAAQPRWAGAPSQEAIAEAARIRPLAVAMGYVFD